MKPRTFNADSIQEAVDRIRRELGPEALVLSVRQVEPSGVARLWRKAHVEVVASEPVPEAPMPARPATDPLRPLREEIAALRRDLEMRNEPRTSSSEGVLSALPKERAPVAAFCEEAGLSRAFAAQVQACVNARRREVDEDLSESLRHVLSGFWRKPVPAASTGPEAHVFLGPPGSGKTTCLAKRLAQATLLEGRSARVFRLDAATANESAFLDMHCEVLGVPVHRRWTGPEEGRFDEPRFIDLPGIEPSDLNSVSQVRAVLRSIPNARVHLVLNAAYETSVLLSQAASFSSLPVTDLVLTHLDEDRRWGKIWNLVMGTNYTISWLGSGQNIPGELAPALPERILPPQLIDSKEVVEPLGLS